MLLTPHHFQQADNYHEDLLQSRIGSLVAHEWGLLDLEFNQDSIRNGSVELLRCSGVMPDGLWLELPQLGSLPAKREVEGRFKESANRLDVYLAIPAVDYLRANVQKSGGEPAPAIRFLQEEGTVVDEVVSDIPSEREIAFARGNFRLLFGDELREGYSAIKIAELTRTATGQLALVDHYVPPALNVRASHWLGNLLRQLVEFLVAKSNSLGARRREGRSGMATFNAAELTDFWMLHTIYSAIPLMAHLFHTSERHVVHPERLYLAMSQLAGELMTFSMEHHPKDIVHYDHKDLYNTFRQLDAVIRFMLSQQPSERCVPIPLEKTREAVYVGQVKDERLLKEAEFILAVGAQIPDPQLITRVPFAIKIADSGSGIDACIASFVPGVSLRHASPPPPAIPTRVGMHYFRLDRNDRDLTIQRYWDQIIGLQTIAVWVADEFPDVKLELYAIKP